MRLNIIVAADNKRGIGKENTMPWKIPQDLHRFQLITKSHTVIMGRKTWESLPEKRRPLPDRFNIVISRDKNYKLPEGVALAGSLKEAIEIAEKKGNSPGESTNPEGPQKIFIIGGAQIFAQALDYPEPKDLWYTRIEATFDCDTFFPEIPKTFTKIADSDHFKEGKIPFHFEIWREKL
jgi:dihydrofolate reductase